MKDYIQSARFEHRFWLRVLKDHSQFILDALAEKEKEEMAKAKEFIQIFSTLFEQADVLENVVFLTERAEEQAEALREFKLSILKKQLTVSEFSIHLSPEFLSHMVNELDEYKLILRYLKRQEAPPVFHELHHHLLWILDAADHAGAISDHLARVEKTLKMKSDEFTFQFEQFYLKAVELTGFLRTNLESFPALSRMNREVQLEIELFQLFLQEIEELQISNQMLSTFSALMADHMMREEVYYLTKVAESNGDEIEYEKG